MYAEKNYFIFNIFALGISECLEGFNCLLQKTDFADTHSLWIKVSAGSTKRSTILKKCWLLDSNVPFGLQLEAKVLGNPNTIVIAKFYISMQDLCAAVESASGSIKSEQLVHVNTSDRVIESQGLLNSFRPVVLATFFQLLCGNDYTQ